MKISIVTVCYNAADSLVPTMESVLAQTYTDLEYVVKDGGSTDETERIVRGFRDRFEAKGISFKYISEKDGGIYDAMNRAVDACSGEYINFMNAGDCFYEADVVKKIAGAAGSARSGEDLPGILYGDCAVYEYGRFFLFQKRCDMIDKVMPFSHQSVFARAKLLRDHPFVTGYRYSADYDFLLTMHDNNVKMCDSGCVVCITTADGTSSINYHDTLMETAKIQKAHGIARPDTELAKTEKVLRIKQFVMDHFPVAVKRYIRDRQIRARGQSFDPVIPVWFKG